MTRPFCAALTFALALTSTAVFADPIRIVQDFGSTRTQVNTPLGGHTDDKLTGDVRASSITISEGANSGNATATMTSSVSDPMHWTGVGAADVAWTATTESFYNSGAIFQILFDVLTPVTYSFNGELFQTHTDAPAGGRSSTSAFARLGTGTGLAPLFNFELEGGANQSAGSRSFQGVIGPGRYGFTALAGALGSGVGTGAAASNFSFTLDFSPAAVSSTPEPASLFLLGTGVAGLFGCRRRRTQRSDRT